MLEESNFTKGRDFTQSTVFLSPHRQGILWIAVFDSGTAKIFEKNTAGLDILYKLENKQPVDDGIDKDSIGSAGAYGSGRHGYEPSMDESRQTEMSFVRDLSAWLEKAKNLQQFDDLVLVAPPRVLGELRSALSKNVLQCITLEESKDLTKHSTEDLEKRLDKMIGQ